MTRYLFFRIGQQAYLSFVRQEHIIVTNCTRDIFQATDRFVNNRVKRMDSLVLLFSSRCSVDSGQEILLKQCELFIYSSLKN